MYSPSGNFDVKSTVSFEKFSLIKVDGLRKENAVFAILGCPCEYSGLLYITVAVPKSNILF